MYVPNCLILSLMVLLPKASICYDYGFENSETCSERKQRQSKQLKLPCKEIQELGYCLTAGNHYPWRAVSHFINENRGLMKKLYGKQEQFSMLSTELQSNYLHQSDHIVDRHPYRKQMRTDKFTPFNEKASLKSSKLRSKLLKIANSIYNTKFVYNTNLDIDNELPIIIKTLNSNKDEDSILEAVNMSIETNFLDDIPLESYNSTVARNSSSSTEESSVRTKSKVSSSESDEIEEETQTVAAAAAAAAIVSATTFDSLESSTVNDDAETSTISSKNGDTETENNETDTKYEEAPVFSSKIDNAKTDSETETPTVPPTKFEGVNACEVTEEVVAPYWANSTSGEILALLNTYPYEQYVHWEKCRSLNQKMNCRSGCRCEQQHRLYRLLAYDPKNECRGVFMDWFKLPCCCTCKCYDIPTQIKVSSRTPRGGLQKDIFYNYKV